MHELIDIAVANAITAAGLAIIAWMVARAFRNPALTHLLCVLVLLKLITPPIVDLPVRLPIENPLHWPSFDSFNIASRANWNLIARWGLIAWILGGMSWFIFQLRMAAKLRAAMGCAAPAPPYVAELASRLASRMKVRRPPPIRLLSAIDSPMLYGVGPSNCIVLPAAMLERLSLAALETVLAHELAHVARRDHWGRLLESIVIGCFWWHPSVWWARRRIAVAQEQCCDAIVCGHCAANQRQYAEAILDVVDWLAERRQVPARIATTDSDQRGLLIERIQVLVGATRPAIIPRGASIAFGAFAVACLLIQPSWQWSSAPQFLPLMAASRQDASTEIGRNRQNATSVEWATIVSPDAAYEVSVSPGYRCKLTERQTGKSQVLAGEQVTCLAFAPGEDLIVGTAEGSVQLVDLAGSREPVCLVSGTSPISSVDVSAVRECVVAADQQGRIAVLPLDGSQPVEAAFTRASQSPVRSVRFSLDGRHLAVLLASSNFSATAHIEIIDLESEQVVCKWIAAGPVGAIRFASDNRLMTADWGGRVEYRRTSDGQILSQLDVPKGIVSAEAFSADADGLIGVVKELDSASHRNDCK